jgi:hypothetical protein
MGIHTCFAGMIFFVQSLQKRGRFNAKNKNTPGRREAFQPDRDRQGQKKQGVRQPYSDHQDPEKEKKLKKISHSR